MTKMFRHNYNNDSSDKIALSNDRDSMTRMFTV